MIFKCFCRMGCKNCALLCGGEEINILVCLNKFCITLVYRIHLRCFIFLFNIAANIRDQKKQTLCLISNDFFSVVKIKILGELVRSIIIVLS